MSSRSVPLGSPSMVTFAPTVRDFPGSTGFWSMSAGQDVAPPVQKASEMPGISMCTVLMAIIVFLVVFYILTLNGGPCERYRHAIVNGMRAVVKSKSPTPANTKDVHLKLDDEVTRTTICRPGSKNCVHNLTECTGDDCKDIKNVDPAFRQAADNKIVEFNKTNKTCMYMIYAPWCPHCHTAMPKFFEAAKKAKCPFAVINAELVSPTLLQGENALFNVQFFPFIVRRQHNGDIPSDTVYKGAPCPDGYHKFSEMDQMDHFFS